MINTHKKLRELLLLKPATSTLTTVVVGALFEVGAAALQSKSRNFFVEVRYQIY